MALKQKQVKPKRKPVDGHQPVMVNIPITLLEKVDRFVEEDEYTSRSEWIRNELRNICTAREDES